VFQRARSLKAALMLLAAARLSAEGPPTAPEGYSWQRIDSVKAAFLMPKGWYFKEETPRPGVHAFFISQEDIGKGGEFETGLTVNVFVPSEGKAQERALAHIAGLAQTPGNELQETWQMETGVLKGVGGRFRRVDKDYPPLIMHVLAVGNSATNTLYIIMFESPEKTWDKAWVKGEQMMKLFVLDDEV
jgi:hypothetical protein